MLTIVIGDIHGMAAKLEIYSAKSTCGVRRTPGPSYAS